MAGFTIMKTFDTLSLTTVSLIFTSPEGTTSHAATHNSTMPFSLFVVKDKLIHISGYNS
jgi:hypothetical protein